MENPKISIIVPVYKVEPYLRRCLESIVNQTYRNLEIIVVDDGSPDHCGAICDEYAAKDERVKAVHKANAGAASARNTGLDMASGDYIGWVDSDDWIEPQMFEVMLSGIMIYDADVAICGREESFPNQLLQIGWKKTELLNREQAIGLLIEDDLVRSYLWDKLWKRELFREIRIPQIKVYEDLAIMYPLFVKAERVVCLPDILYHYEHRDTGLTAAPSLKDRIDFCRITGERYDALERDFPLLRERLMPVLVTSAIPIWTTYYESSREERKRFDFQIKLISAFCRKHYKDALKRKRLGIIGRLSLRLICHVKPWAFWGAWLMNKLYQWRHGKPL